jgi:hypothetical protein
MSVNSRRLRLLTALLATAIAAFGISASAQAKLVGEFTRFANCEYKNTEVKKCLYSVTESGEVVLGTKKVPIVNPVTLQGGVRAVGEDEFGQFVAPESGPALSKAPQPVPGGLAGLVNCKEISEPFVRFTCELALENGVTGVNSTLELARPASEIRVSENHLAGEYETALEMPVKFHLENPLLGPNCYVGSSSSPVIWKLTSGETSPPPPNTPIHGTAGTPEFLEGVRILHLKGATLVDNAWSAPGATGCGGPLVELVLDPVIDVSGGLPSAAGHNTAILNNEIYVTSAAALRKVDAENP